MSWCSVGYSLKKKFHTDVKMRKEETGDGTEEMVAVTGEAERKGKQVTGCFCLGSRKYMCCEQGSDCYSRDPRDNSRA